MRHPSTLSVPVLRSSRRAGLSLFALTFALLPGCGDDPTPGSDASVLHDGSVATDAGTATDQGHAVDQGVTTDASSGVDSGMDSGAGADAGVPTDMGQLPQDQGGNTGGGLADLLSAALWAEMFPNGNALYTRAALVAAAAYYPAFATTGTPTQRRQELAAFLANIAHETTGGWPTAPGGAQAWGLYFIEEVGCESGACTGYCDASNQTYPCAAGRTYHGRGPIQLSWNYNYGQVGAVLGLDLLNQPSLVTSDGVVAFRTALWFWMTAQAPKPSAHDVMTGGWTPTSGDIAGGRQPGFGMTINIINGGLECQQPTNSKQQGRRPRGFLSALHRHAGDHHGRESVLRPDAELLTRVRANEKGRVGHMPTRPLRWRPRCLLRAGRHTQRGWQTRRVRHGRVYRLMQSASLLLWLLPCEHQLLDSAPQPPTQFPPMYW